MGALKLSNLVASSSFEDRCARHGRRGELAWSLQRMFALWRRSNLSVTRSQVTSASGDGLMDQTDAWSRHERDGYTGRGGWQQAGASQRV